MSTAVVASPDVFRLARAALVGLGLSLLASGPLMARVDLNTASQSQLEWSPFAASAQACPSAFLMNANGMAPL